MKNSFLETIKILDGEVYNLSFHQARYESVLNFFGINSFIQLSILISPPLQGLYRCRLSYTLKNEISISYIPYKKRSIQSLKIIHNDSIDYTFKYENRDLINQLFDLRQSCDDILIVKNGLITDTSIANIAFYDGTTWRTPREPLLKGTTRQRLLENKKIIEADISVSELSTFSQVALLNAMIDFDIIPNIRYIHEG